MRATRVHELYEFTVRVPRRPHYTHLLRIIYEYNTPFFFGTIMYGTHTYLLTGWNDEDEGGTRHNDERHAQRLDASA